MGPDDRTRRDIGLPKSWRGLSMCDRAVLSAWLTRPGGGCTELHTDVCVGHISEELRAAASAIPERQLEAMYARRIDALVLGNGRGLGVEGKSVGKAHWAGQGLKDRAGPRRWRHTSFWCARRGCRWW